MTRYRVTLGDLDKRDPERKLKALRELRDGPKTAIDLSAAFDIDETTSYRLLKRFCQQGFASCEDGRPSFRGKYSITEDGIQKLEYWEENGANVGLAGRAFISKVKRGLEKHLCSSCTEKLKGLGLIK